MQRAAHAPILPYGRTTAGHCHLYAAVEAALFGDEAARCRDALALARVDGKVLLGESQRLQWRSSWWRLQGDMGLGRLRCSFVSVNARSGAAGPPPLAPDDAAAGGACCRESGC